MSRRTKKAAREPPEQTEWRNLVRLDAVQDFAHWLAAPEQGWRLTAPDRDELLRAEKAGRRIIVAWDEARGGDGLPKGSHGALVCVCV